MTHMPVVMKDACQAVATAKPMQGALGHLERLQAEWWNLAHHARDWQTATVIKGGVKQAWKLCVHMCVLVDTCLPTLKHMKSVQSWSYMYICPYKGSSSCHHCHTATATNSPALQPLCMSRWHPCCRCCCHLDPRLHRPTTQHHLPF